MSISARSVPGLELVLEWNLDKGRGAKPNLFLLTIIRKLEKRRVRYPAGGVFKAWHDGRDQWNACFGSPKHSDEEPLGWYPSREAAMSRLEKRVMEKIQGGWDPFSSRSRATRSPKVEQEALPDP